MGLFQIALIVAAFLCSLVAGFLFTFAVVVMPGMRNLSDRAFIRAFQVIDRVIQDNQPIFMLVWIGSVLTLLAAAVLGFGQLDRVGRVLITGATIAYLLGVQLPTALINVPLNNTLQTLAVATMDESHQRAAREHFEPRWNRWNVFRTILSCLTSAVLLVLLLRL
jgi:uncharacterized membrane protein